MKLNNPTLAVLIILVFTGCSIVNVGYDQDKSITFGQYQTFAWYAKDPTKVKNSEYDNQIVESNIKNIVSGQLKARGLKVELDTPDVLFFYDFKIEQKINQQQIPIYSHPYNYNNGYNNMYNNNGYNNMYNNGYNNNYNNMYNNGYNNMYNNGYNNMYNNSIYNNNNFNNQPVIVGYKTQNVPYTDGTLTISMVDKKTNRLIWRGWGEGALTDEQTYESQLPEVIKEIFKNFPIPKLPTPKRVQNNYPYK